MYVGRATYAKLLKYGIRTIGDLACADISFLERLLGKNGLMLWAFANGLDHSPVSHSYSRRVIKTIGNSTTTPRDLINDTDIKIILYILSESVAERMRKEHFYCRSVQVTIRDNTLASYERQGRLSIPSCTSQAIFEKAFTLFRDNRPQNPVRSLGVRACNLMVSQYRQLSFMEDAVKDQKQEDLERAFDQIRQRYGHYSIQRGIMLMDTSLSHLDPIAEHTIYPESFLKSQI